MIRIYLKRFIEVDGSVDQSPAGKICHDDPDAVFIVRTKGSISENVCSFIVDASSHTAIFAWEVWIYMLVTRGPFSRPQARRT